MNLYEVLRRPLISEKNSVHAMQNKYAFEIAKGANKRMVKLAVEQAFNVTVEDVNMLHIPGKQKRMGRNLVQTAGLRKAIITLKEGDKITLFEGV
ncbi:50S ribosomal protein L23 [Dehalococcoides sp. THU3]|uniref:Large ribosomal subunit protein uL23 n=1 Tax=Dehalococcoides mccartyi (strain VS) TaxID=311424 RepID=D2BGX4_DEHMV|nr:MULTISPECIES: 50S ribosomal protein L23 [Dehalococcoides]ACZ61574.1 ribosomal protein L23 [Dehalococcoides mccartyi VS]QYY58288.1 50S ribosomal protein L23 [Dehalococcoides mccartyi]BAQ34365.1 50S ribosomal protein L23 [Dehalococcoides sp. UCH007]